MKHLTAIALAVAAVGTSGCSSLGGTGYGISSYSPVNVKRVNVGNGAMSVVPPRPWNRERAIRFDDISAVEDWTLNGPVLDAVSFITALKHNRDIIRQRRTDDQQVPRFRADMTPPEIASMLESLYRVRGGTIEFRTLALAPRQFLGTNGFQFDFEHLDSDELWRKGRAVGAVINGRLYLMLYDAARSHYYEAALPDFEAMVGSAQLRTAPRRR